MSIGPTQKDGEFSTKMVEKIQQSVKKSFLAYFENPIHYIFYCSVAAIIIGLFLGKEFSWKLYAIVGILGMIKIFNHFNNIYGSNPNSRINS